MLWPNGYKACGSLERAQALVRKGVLTLVGVPIARVQVLERFPDKKFYEGISVYDTPHLLQEKLRNWVSIGLDEATRLDIFGKQSSLRGFASMDPRV